MTEIAKSGAGRFFSVLVCIVIIVCSFSSCGDFKLEEDVTVVTAEPTTVPPSTEPLIIEPTKPELVGFNSVAKPDEHGERRSPNVNYYVPYSDRVGPEYFDNAVFIGDSVTETLKYYNMAQGSFGQALFLSSSSLSAGNALWDLNDPNAYHPLYQGSKVYLYDGVALSGKKKVYIMLGVNELGWVDAETCLGSLLKVTDAILQKSPDVMFYMQSVTPLSYERGQLNTELINEYNARLSETCRERGWYFIDVASMFRDETGHLPEKYCSDPGGMGIHFNNEACKMWVDYLYTHAPAEGTVPVPQPTIFDFNVDIPESTTAPESTKVDTTIIEAVAVEESTEEKSENKNKETTKETEKEKTKKDK